MLDRNIKTTVLIAITISALLLSCQKDSQPIAPTEFTEAQYQQMISDSAWIEITDTIYHFAPIFDPELMNNGAVINSEAELYNLFVQSKEFVSNKYPRDTAYFSAFPEIDYSQRTLLGYYIELAPVTNYLKRVFINETIKKYRYIIELNKPTGKYILLLKMNWLSTSKIPSDYSI